MTCSAFDSSTSCSRRERDRQKRTRRRGLGLPGRSRRRAPIKIRKRRKPNFNRRPITPERLVLLPDEARADGPILCRAELDPLVDDPDYDIVRYHYVWTVNGEPVREVTSTVRTDVLAAGTSSSGDTLRCTVIPLDATKVGRASKVEVTVH